MSKCIFMSFFNSNNLGDMLIANSLCNDIINCGYKVRRCSYEGSFSIINRLKTPRPIAYNFLQKIIYSFQYKVSRWGFRLRFLIEMALSDVLILGGGNMIMDLSPTSRSALHFQHYVDIAKALHKRVIVLSIGLGPFQTQDQQNMACKALSKCDFVTYRDKASFVLANNNLIRDNHFVSIDPVFTLPRMITKQITPIKVIGICAINSLLFDSSSKRYRTIMDSFVKLCHQLLTYNYSIMIFSTDESDNRMVDDIVAACNNSKVEGKRISNIAELLCLYSNISFLIATRMHSLIIAYTQYLPIIGLSWQRKIDSMFELLDLEKYCFNIDKMAANLDQICHLVNQSILSTNDDQITNKLRELYDLYSINKRILTSTK